MIITVDTREPPENYEFLSNTFRTTQFKKEALSEGDYATEKVLVERKTVSDLYGSIIGNREKAGRLQHQVSRLSTHTDKIVYIMVVGNIFDYIRKMDKLGIPVNPDIIYATLSSICCRENIHVMWHDHESDALINMVRFMMKVEDNKYHIPSRRDPDHLTARLLNITLPQWMALKSKYSTIYGVMQAPDTQIMEVKGIGKIKARKIKEILKSGW